MASRSLAASALIAIGACGGNAPPPEPPVPQEPARAEPALPSSAETGPAWLGVRFDPGTTRVVQVIELSPAAVAGLRVGDEIVSLDGVAMHGSQEIVQTVGDAKPGRPMTIVLTRGGNQLTLRVKLASRPDERQLMQNTLLDRPAPAFSAPALDGGKPVTLASLRGHVVLVDFWATWCEPCTTQFPHLNQWHKQYTSKGLRIVALSDEEADQVREFTAAEKLAYPVALDPGEKIRAAYLVPGIPTTVLIDKDGVVRYVRVGAASPVEIETAITELLR
jgi:peroxiredoxin